MGEKDPENYRWNHQPFSSKIKEVQVSPHAQGHIMEVNFRYVRGEPPRISKAPFASFCCQENSDEHITCMRGGFKTGLLRFLVVETNCGRKSNFCQHDLENSCITFEFRANDNEYLGALFGENSSQGVTQLGCFIEFDL
jgi:hypothetical protein